MLDDLPFRLWIDRWVGKSNCCIATATDFISETVKHVTQKHSTWNQARLPPSLFTVGTAEWRRPRDFRTSRCSVLIKSDHAKAPRKTDRAYEMLPMKREYENHCHLQPET